MGVVVELTNHRAVVLGGGIWALGIGVFFTGTRHSKIRENFLILKYAQIIIREEK